MTMVRTYEWFDKRPDREVIGPRVLEDDRTFAEIYGDREWNARMSRVLERLVREGPVPT